MSISPTPYKYNENPNKLKAYLQGVIDGQKRGMDAMKVFACVEFIKILHEICPELVQTDDDIRALKIDFLKRLDK
jgi:hypothetical protein